MASLLNNASLLLNPAGSIIAYEEDKILSVLPSNGTGDFTFSGGDGGTRVNQQGYVEVTPANINTYSEKFGPGYWTTYGGTITDDSVVAPNGTVTGTTFNGSPAGVYKTFPGIVPGQVYTVSMYVKLGTATNCVIIVNNSFAWNTVGGKSFTSADGLNTTDWVRISYTFTGPASGQINWHIGYQFETGITQQTNGTYFVWGAQLNIGSTAKPYQPTTDRLNYPRITYQNGRGALLSEPQRTNLVLYSQQFDASGWVQYNSGTVTANSTISPDGTQNAYTLNVAATGYSGLYRTVSGGTGIATVSGFFKKGTLDWVLLVNTNGSDGVAWFNLANGTIGTVDAGYSAAIEPFKDGWYKCSVTCPSQTIGIWQIGGATSDNNPTPAYAGNIYIYGAQVEVGGFPTSYIPTTSATVTRPADVSYVNGISSIIGQTQGVLYAQVTPSQLVDGSYICISDNTTTNRLIFGFELGTQAVYWYTPYGNGAGGSVVVGKQCKIAAAYNVNDFSIYLNGTQIGSYSSGQLSGTYSHLGLDSYTATAQTFKGTVNNVALFNTRLTNNQLAELTTVRSGSGGNISYYGPYTIHTFTGSATFTPSFTGPVEVLVVAGGGGGGYDGAGGGGAGGLLYVSSYGVTVGTGVTVTVGAGGPGASNVGTQASNGGNSVFGGLNAIGGGGGGSKLANGANGGSGGGGGHNAAGVNSQLGGTGIIGQGFNGGNNNAFAGGGGGGAAQSGSNPPSSTPGNGGNGLPFSISGFSNYYAGGGGGGGYASAVTSSGGLGGGGNGGGNLSGGAASAAGKNGVNYTGGGGGANGNLGDSAVIGTGGSGIVIVRYLT